VEDAKAPRTIDMERLANSYYFIKAYSLAENWYARVLEQPDASQEAHLHYAEVLKQLGKYTEAKEQYTAYAAKYGESMAITNAVLGTDSAAVWVENPTGHKLRNAANI